MRLVVVECFGNLGLLPMVKIHLFGDFSIRVFNVLVCILTTFSCHLIF